MYNRITALARRKDELATLIQQQTGFQPDRHGFRFANRFPDVPVFKLLGVRIPPSAARGLCGGMVYAALDYYSAGAELPPVERLFAEDGTILPETEWLLDFIVRRLVASFNVLDFRNGALNYYRLMRPGFPDACPVDPDPRRAPRSRAWTMVRVEWPLIRAKLDAGQPVPLGLVRAKLAKFAGPRAIVAAYQQDHQVLAYGYDLEGNALTLRVYDPNHPGDGGVGLRLDVADPGQPVPVRLFVGEKEKGEVQCFFHTRYRKASPPAR